MSLDTRLSRTIVVLQLALELCTQKNRDPKRDPSSEASET